jgi:hypothetical protein
VIMSDILFWFFVILGVYLTLIAHWVCAHALFPRVVDHARATYGRRPIAATLLGLVNAAPTFFLAVAATHVLPHPVIHIAAVVLLMVAGLLCLLGSAGLASRIGAGLSSPADATQPWIMVLRGGAFLGLVFLMPLLGWFMLLPWTLISGLGAAVMALRASARVAQPALSARPPIPEATSLRRADETVDTVFSKP